MTRLHVADNAIVPVGHIRVIASAVNARSPGMSASFLTLWFYEHGAHAQATKLLARYAFHVIHEGEGRVDFECRGAGQGVGRGGGLTA